MTDQSQPHRQDGNAPPLEVQIQVARYAIFRLLRANAPHERLREEWSKLETLFDTPATPSQSREAVEGDNWHADFQARCRALGAVPPKPAPDAMRDDIALALINEQRTFHGLDEIVWDFPALSTDSKQRARRQATAILARFGAYAISAPAPSPDGADIARCLETIEGAYNFASDPGPLKNCGEWKYLKQLLSARASSGAVAAETSASTAARNFSEVVPAKTVEPEPVDVGAVAAEPVAQMLEYARRLNDIATTCQIDGREGDANDLWRIAKQIVAAPPVRRDREAISPAIENLANNQKPCDMDGVFVMVSRQALTEVLDFLSLPVQPGAGEREAKAIQFLLHLADVAYFALDNSETRADETMVLDAVNAKTLCATMEQLDTLPDDQPGYTMTPNAKARWALRALSRQPPPSSSDGERR